MPRGSTVTTVLLADDHRMLREGLRRSLVEHGLKVLGEAADGREAVELALELGPDVVLMDLSMPGLDGIAATRLVRQRAPETHVVILTMHSDDDSLARAIRAGASGYLVKDCSTDELVDAIEKVASGEVTLSPELAASMLEEDAGEPVISEREKEVLQLIADGLSPTEVAGRLYISVKTVKNHLTSIYQKLDSRDRTQAVVRAVRMGIIRLD
jgi:two-component system, NarL family, response regulator DegU